jgi:phosphoribosylaminoimidazole-succinocarboxamide synthase
MRVLPEIHQGKVRRSERLDGGLRCFVTSDRLSAFDRIIGEVPGKGAVLNQLSWWWFDRTRTIAPNHAVRLDGPTGLVAIETTPLPVEIVVRRAITGVTSTSLWTRYAAGARVIDGHRLPDGLRKNDLLPEAIVTPTTKGDEGHHDEPLSCDDVLARGLVDEGTWAEALRIALAIVDLAAHEGERAGLVLADTKLEMGVAPDGRLLVIDELLTPDSSRWWDAATYAERHARGEEPESFDKEIVRRALAAQGFRGDGPIPALSDEVWAETSRRYHELYERLVGAPCAVS